MQGEGLVNDYCAAHCEGTVRIGTWRRAALLRVLHPRLLVLVCLPVLVFLPVSMCLPVPVCLPLPVCLPARLCMLVGFSRPASLGVVAFLFLLGAALGTVATGSLLLLILGLDLGSTDSPGATFNFAADEQAVWQREGQAGRWGAPALEGTCGAQVAEDLEALRTRRRKPDPSCRSSEGNVWGTEALCSHDPGLVAWAMDTGGAVSSSRKPIKTSAGCLSPSTAGTFVTHPGT